MFSIFPLLILVVIAFNVVVFAGGMVSLEGVQDQFSVVITNVPMMSGDVWQLTLGNLFVIVSLIFLFIEIAKATRTDTSSIINHGLSLVVFIICLLEFLLIKGFGNSTFFLITCMTLLDVIAGFTVTISTARRDLGVGEGIFGAS